MILWAGYSLSLERETNHILPVSFQSESQVNLLGPTDVYGLPLLAMNRFQPIFRTLQTNPR